MGIIIDKSSIIPVPPKKDLTPVIYKGIGRRSIAAILS
jgi:hypothetical protein